MEAHTQILQRLLKELFTPEEIEQIKQLAKIEPFNLDALLAFDERLGGPGISHINCQNSGRYAIADRDIFRPLQYCGTYFTVMISESNEAGYWLTRDIVEMSSLHIEGLVKRIGKVPFLPLGMALRKKIVKRKVNLVIWKQIETYTHIYNSAKHDFSQDKDTHMFSLEDAILAYFICRQLGMRLYPLANLVTDITLLEQKCDEAEKARMPKLGNNPFMEKN